MTQPKDTSELVARLLEIRGTIDAAENEYAVTDEDYRQYERERETITQAADELVNAYRIIGEMRSVLDEIAHARWPSVNGDDPVRRIQQFAREAIPMRWRPA